MQHLNTSILRRQRQVFFCTLLFTCRGQLNDNRRSKPLPQSESLMKFRLCFARLRVDQPIATNVDIVSVFEDALTERMPHRTCRNYTAFRLYAYACVLRDYWTSKMPFRRLHICRVCLQCGLVDAESGYPIVRTVAHIRGTRTASCQCELVGELLNSAR